MATKLELIEQIKQLAEQLDLTEGFVLDGTHAELTAQLAELQDVVQASACLETANADLDTATANLANAGNDAEEEAANAAISNAVDAVNDAQTAVVGETTEARASLMGLPDGSAFVADGVSITSKRGLILAGQHITADMLAGGTPAFTALIAAGKINVASTQAS